MMMEEEGDVRSYHRHTHAEDDHLMVASATSSSCSSPTNPPSQSMIQTTLLKPEEPTILRPPCIEDRNVRTGIGFEELMDRISKASLTSDQVDILIAELQKKKPKFPCFKKSMASSFPNNNNVAVPAPVPPPPQAAAFAAAHRQVFLNCQQETQQQAPTPPPPVFRGTLSYSVNLHRHVIRGLWNYENTNNGLFPPQRFELIRDVKLGEDPKVMPMDGDYHGSFCLAYNHTTSKGKCKERNKIITENQVQIKFTKICSSGSHETEDEGEVGGGGNRACCSCYQMDGKGGNQFGIFYLNGMVTLSIPSSSFPDDCGHRQQYDVVFRKVYHE